MKDEQLELRVDTFLTRLVGAESIDILTIPLPYVDLKRADYLLNSRQLIVEVKCLENDPSHKIEAAVDAHRHRDDFPVFYGSMQLERVLQNLSDGDEIKRKLLQRVLRSVEAAVRSADDQVLDTKTIFDLPNSDGLLILLNEGVAVLSPEIIAWQLARMLTVLEKDGAPRYRGLNSIWLISEAHFVSLGPLQALPAAFLESERIPLSAANRKYVASLQPAWAAFNGLPLVETTAKITDVRPRTPGTPAAGDGKIQRHELWRLAYRAKPYLRALSEPDFVDYGAKLIGGLVPYFVKTDQPSQQRQETPAERTLHIQREMERFTHFLEEANFRGLDMRRVTQRIKAAGGT